MRPETTRFAPSPTGSLHLGHAYAAFFAHDLARRTGGRFLVRLEDIDAGRCRPEFEQGILEDLSWLGLASDAPVLRQSARMALYRERLAGLTGRGLTYPCFCTRAEIAAEVERMAAAPQGPDGPIYPGTCRALDGAERARRMEAGQSFAIRLDVAACLARVGGLHFDDVGRGRIPVDASALGDVVLGRKDLGVSYHLAVVIDDDAQGVTTVTRGEDLFVATHLHRLLQAILDLATPRYHHHALVRDASGRRLAKRDRASTLAELRAGGVTPAEIRARLGA